MVAATTICAENVGDFGGCGGDGGGGEEVRSNGGVNSYPKGVCIHTYI